MNNFSRFSGRANNYAKYRPSYPAAIADLIRDACGLRTGGEVADIGSGTGLLSRLFLERGYGVYGIEPNLAMREQAENELLGFANFQSIDGSAENTSLPPGSVDLIVAGQSFHWFDRIRAREEFRRILRRGGWTALIWNRRVSGGSQLMSGIENLMQTFGRDYKRIHHQAITVEELEPFFGHPAILEKSFENNRLLSLEELQGLLASHSYLPSPAEPDYRKLCAAIRSLAEKHAEQGRVTYLLRTDVFCAEMR